MKRNPRKLPWTKSFRRAHGKEMTIDTTLSFAARRNVPTRYNRDHVTTTIKAMERISEIRTKRERAFYKKRMAGNKERQRALDRKLVEENAHLLPRERGSERIARERAEMGEEMDEMLEEEEAVGAKAKTQRRKKVLQTRLVGGETGMEIDED